MPHAYMVRITHSYQDASGVVALWATRAEKMVVYEHVGTVTEKIHIHMVIFGSDTHKKQLRNIGMATGLELKGNAFCSFKEFDGNERCFVYMTKGQHDPSYIKGYTEADAQRWKGLYERSTAQSSDARLYDTLFADDEYTEECYKYWHENYDQSTLNMEDQLYFTVHSKFMWLKHASRTFVMEQNHFVWNLKAINMYKMLVYTYCFRNGLVIPKNDPVFKIF